MSSRLLSMKFMQRGIASSSTASSPTTPRAEDVSHTSKRPGFGGPQSPALDRKQSSSGTQLDEKAVQVALVEEDRKRHAAIAKQATELGDSHWVLDFPTVSPALSTKKVKIPLKVVHVGFAQIDKADKGEDEGYGGVQIRRFNMNTKSSLKDAKKEPKQDVWMESDSGSEDSDDSNSSNLSTPYTPHPDGSSSTRGREYACQDSSTRKRGRSETSSRRNSERTKAQELSSKRRKKEVRLNRPVSISSANSFAPSPSSNRRHSGKGGL